MATGTLKNNNYTYELIANTNNATSVTYSKDLSQYKFIFLSLGSGGGNYANNIISTCLIGVINGLHAVVFSSSSGAYVCQGAINFNTKTLSTTSLTYPAYMYGIK